MNFTIPGFPTEVSDLIDMPDIGELLMYPAFQGILAEDFLEYATEFQKYLFNKIPLRNDKKYVTIRSTVHLLEPGFRSHVGGNGEGPGWHIDGIDKFDHREANERVFVLSTPCKSLTEFNLNPIEIVDSSEYETRDDICKRINKNPNNFGVIGKMIEPNRIYTFENHLHRAVEPPRIEFRYFLRVRETNSEDVYAKTPNFNIYLTEVNSNKKYQNLKFNNDNISIYVPKSICNIKQAVSDVSKQQPMKS